MSPTDNKGKMGVSREFGVGITPTVLYALVRNAQRVIATLFSFLQILPFYTEYRKSLRTKAYKKIIFVLYHHNTNFSSILKPFF